MINPSDGRGNEQTLAIRQAIVLAGGRGKRLGQLTQAIPKPLLPVNGRPFIEYLLDSLCLAGVTDIILSCGYLANAFISRYHNTSWGAQATLSCATESKPMGTGGALMLLRHRLEERFFVLNGDSFLVTRWAALTQALVGDNRWVAVAVLRHNDQTQRYGQIQQRADGLITAFNEKTPQTTSHLINGGVYAMKKQALPENIAPCSLEQEVLPELVAHRLVSGIIHDGDFIDIGIPKDYQKAHSLPLLRDRPRS